MMKGQKGITLVALIITIIVMLILVGVSISVAMNGGLFDTAGKASRQSKQAQISEAAALTKAELLSDFYAAKTDAERAKPLDTEVEKQVNAYLADSDITVKVTEDSSTPGKYLITTTDVDYVASENEVAPVIDLSGLAFAPAGE